MKLSLRARFLNLATEVMGPRPVHFRDNTQNTATLARAFAHWAERAHMHARLALLDYNIRRYKQWLMDTATCYPRG